ncbi:MAG: hypothetical protein SGI77_22865 [Pirellulaceae bacterium]|nr:hypothetical protein [Pirellulaceae bacterium]
MTTDEKKANEKILRGTFRTMDAFQAQEIRDAYYKAIEGLRTLADALEIADADNPGPASPLLIEEHLLACEAIGTMNRSLLGRFL